MRVQCNHHRLTEPTSTNYKVQWNGENLLAPVAWCNETEKYHMHRVSNTTPHNMSARSSELHSEVAHALPRAS